MKLEIVILMLILTTECIQSQPLVEQYTIECLVLQDKLMQASEDVTLLQRKRLDEVIQKLNLKKSIKSDFQFERVFVQSLPYNKDRSLTKEQLITILKMHIDVMTSFSDYIHQMVNDPNCQQEMNESNEKKIKQYLESYMSAKIRNDIKERVKVMKKTCNLQELQYTFHPPSTNTYTKYSKDEHIKTCKSKLGAILKELNIVLSQLEYVYTPSED